MALSCPHCHGTGPDVDSGNVEQRLLPEATSPLHSGHDKEMHRKGTNLLLNKESGWDKNL